MSGRTFATGDIHGDLDALRRIEAQLPSLDAGDTLLFLGDYVNRGPESAAVIRHLRALPQRTSARVVCLRGNHEDAWLRIIDHGWPEFAVPPHHGCRSCLESYLGKQPEDLPEALMDALLSGAFFPDDVVAWIRSLLFYYEDEHAIYVHAGLPRVQGEFRHPSRVEPKTALLWHRDVDFFRNYRGKLVVVGHTNTSELPAELSNFTPEDPTDAWEGPCTMALDTGCGKGGFLTTLELPAMRVYESR